MKILRQTNSFAKNGILLFTLKNVKTWLTRRKQVWILLILCLVFAVHLLFHRWNHRYRCSQWFSSNIKEDAAHIAISCCGERKHEAAVMIKSAMMLTRTTLVFHIFTEHESHNFFMDKIGEFRQLTNVNICYSFYDMHFPAVASISSKAWRSLFVPCASQRLFMHNILTDVKAVLYVDTDVVFLSPPEDMWAHLTLFNSTQFAALAPEQELNEIGWYDLFNDTLHYGAKGVNSGVMLMDLSYLRAHPWEHELIKLLKRHRSSIRLGDQDLLNIFFHIHPEQMYLAPCQFNYRSEFCRGNLTCAAPAKILHGNRRRWYSPEYSPLRGTYRAIEMTTEAFRLPYHVCRNLEFLLKKGCATWTYLFVEEVYKRLDPTYKDRDSLCRINDVLDQL